ncbi:MAG: xanthine dehydrogenase accessory factor [Pseudonocardiales bacterium]|jgi:xanthine dehydrogenase accessory factor|nr:xanthine dehydrogenase accessory factor [Pseudonocardiales bacterium]
MFELAEKVTSWLAEGRPVRIARVVEATGFSSRDRAVAVALTQGQPIAGRILAGAADDQLEELASEPAADGLVELTVAESAARGAGLSCGGAVRLLIQDAAEFGEEFWRLLGEGRPCGLITELGSGNRRSTVVEPGTVPPWDTGDFDVARQFTRGASQTALVDTGDAQLVVTTLWPTPTLVVVGDGLIAEALVNLAELLDWHAATYPDPSAAERISGLRPGDAVAVLSHDLPLAGPALLAALTGQASYVGALGSHRTQSKRRDWLAAQGLDGSMIDRIHGPAGLDIGALTPYEIAVAIMAEALAVRTGRAARPLREQTGSIHRAGLSAPPPRR